MNQDGVWRTAIGHPYDDKILVRGHRLDDLIGTISFPAMVYLELLGRIPSPGEERMLDALFVACVEHGISPSTTVSRFLYASGVPLQVAIGGGIMTFGDIHGGAGEACAKILTEGVVEAEEQGITLDEVATRIVTEARSERRALPGYGHPQHSAGDPRTPSLTRVANETGVAGAHLELALAIGRALSTALSRDMKLNIDGILAAIVADLGFPWQLTRLFIVTPRAVGLAAHSIEEMEREGGWRHIPISDVQYDGPAEQ